MKHGNIKSRFFVTTLAIGVGLAVLFCGKLTPWIPAIDRACVQASVSTNPSDNIIFDGDATTGVISSRQLSLQKEKSRGFHIIAVTDDPNRIFEHTPPSPLDYAVILQSLHNRGYTRVVLATRMTWDDEPGLEAKGLSSRLALFNRAVIALPVTRGATPQPLPEPLASALIPFSQVEGNFKFIPIVNQVTLPAHAGGDAHTLAGFHRIESAPSSAHHIPLLAHWENEGFIPSIELLAIMSAHDIEPEALIVHCGKHIRLGKDGPVIPLDLYGQTPMPTHLSSHDPAQPNLAETLKADELITQKANHPATQRPEVCLIHATGEKTSSTNILSPTQLANLLTLAPSFLMPGKATHYLQVPHWAGIIILLVLGFIVSRLVSFTPWNRHLSFALCTALLFPLLIALIDVSQHWFGISSPLATLFTAWLFPIHQRKHTIPMQEDNTSAPKPAIRA